MDKPELILDMGEAPEAPSSKSESFALVEAEPVTGELAQRAR